METRFRSSCRWPLGALGFSLLLAALIAQDDGGGGFDGGSYLSFGDPGYSVYGEGGSYPMWPGLSGSSLNTGGGFSVANSEGNTVSGNPFSTPQTNTFTPPELWPAPSDPAITQATQELDPNTPNDTRRQYEDLLRQQNAQYGQVFGDPAANARALANDLLGAAGGIKAPTFSPYNPSPLGGGGGDDVPYGEELHNQLNELGKTNDALRQIWQQYGLPQLTQDVSGPQFDPVLNNRYSVQSSDSAPAAVGQTPGPTAAGGFDIKSLFQMPPGSGVLDAGAASFPDSTATTVVGPITDPGGIDFRSVRYVLLTERGVSSPGKSEMRTVRFGLQAVASHGGAKVSLRGGSHFSETAFFSFLSIPDSDLWVNLHPAQPDRIVSRLLGKTEVGFVMLKADLQLKRDAGYLMHQEPFASAERALIEAVLRRTGHSWSDRVSWNSAGRVEITSATSRVFAQEGANGIMIEGVIIDVVFEQKAFRIAIGPRGSEHELPITRDEWARFVSLTDQLVRPGLIRRVNQHPEYEQLRQSFAARVLADWYKRRWKRAGSYSHLIDLKDLPEQLAGHPWSPQEFWIEFKGDYDRGVLRGYGGVSFNRMPPFARLVHGLPANLPFMARSLSSPNGLMYRSVYRTGVTIVGICEASRIRIAGRWMISSALLAIVFVLWRGRGRYL
jgi:hypothetical protein